MFTEQRIRAILFYFSLIAFCLGLPFILSFALGYKFDQRKFTFVKGGLMVVKTQPSGADIYINGKLIADKTPATINELLPDNYNIKLELENYYPWIGQAKVDPGQVNKIDKVILFPLRPDIQQLNRYPFSKFWLDEQKGIIYYLDTKDKSIYSSDLNGEHPERLGDFIEIKPYPKKLLVSENGKKMLYFNSHQLISLGLTDKDNSHATSEFMLSYPNRNILDAFWYSDNYHIIVLTDKNIEILECEYPGSPVNLVNLNKRNATASYDIKTDTLYFVDSQVAEDGKYYDNLYQLKLQNKTFTLPKLMKFGPNSEKSDVKNEENK